MRAFQNRKRVPLAQDFAAWLAPAEYLIIRKLEYYREGKSEKHLDDLKKMLPQVGDSLKVDFLQFELHQRGLVQFWEDLQKKSC